MLSSGALITRGIGSEFLITRGLGSIEIIIELPDENVPRQLQPQFRGSSRKKYEISQTIVGASLVELNGMEIAFPLEGKKRIYIRQDDNIKITAGLSKVKKRKKKLVIHAKYRGKSYG